MWKLWLFYESRAVQKQLSDRGIFHPEDARPGVFVASSILSKKFLWTGVGHLAKLSVSDLLWRAHFLPKHLVYIPMLRFFHDSFQLIYKQTKFQY